MLARVEEFAHLLRQSGVRISTAEVLDAVTALRAVGIARPARVRAALATTLVKNAGDRAIFDELYELYFHRYEQFLGAGAESPGAALAQAAGAPPEQAEDLAREITAAAVQLGPLARAAMGIASPEFLSLMRRAEAEVQLDEIRTPLQVGFYAYRMAEAMGLGQAESQTLAWARAVTARLGLATDVSEAMEARVMSGFRSLRQRIRTHVGQTFALQNRDFAQQLTLDALSDKPLSQLSAKEVAELRREVTRLAELLRSRMAPRPRIDRRGRLDLRRTLRRALATGGVPFELPRRRRRRHKPRLLVLCDISDSVRAVSRFMLQLVYTLQELFDRVQTFAFVAELGEMTPLFRQHELERAIELAYGGAVVSTFANSNYGHTLQQFADRHMDRVTQRTTVMIIGDGRNNYHPSHAHVLGEMRRRAKQVLWLNPEPPSMWGFGDSAMKDYQPHCDRVLVVRSLDGLRKVIDHLIV